MLSWPSKLMPYPARDINHCHLKNHKDFEIMFPWFPNQSMDPLQHCNFWIKETSMWTNYSASHKGLCDRKYYKSILIKSESKWPPQKTFTQNWSVVVSKKMPLIHCNIPLIHIFWWIFTMMMICHTVASLWYFVFSLCVILANWGSHCEWDDVTLMLSHYVPSSLRANTVLIWACSSERKTELSLSLATGQSLLSSHTVKQATAVQHRKTERNHLVP